MNGRDPARAAAYDDELGEKEWTRFAEGRTLPAGLDIHARFLERFVLPGDRVLDAGAGPGRFALELVRLGVVLNLARRDGAARQEELVCTGFLPEAPDYGHLAMHLYHWSDLEALLSRHGEVVAAAAPGLLPDLRPDETELQELVRRLEAELCEEPGAVSCGQHIVAALRVP